MACSEAHKRAQRKYYEKTKEKWKQWHKERYDFSKTYPQRCKRAVDLILENEYELTQADAFKLELILTGEK